MGWLLLSRKLYLLSFIGYLDNSVLDSGLLFFCNLCFIYPCGFFLQVPGSLGSGAQSDVTTKDADMLERNRE